MNEYPGVLVSQDISNKEGKLQLTEGQLQVMKNKYLKGDAPETWLKGVAHNIALAEVLYSGMDDDHILREVHYERKNSESRVTSLLLHKKGSTYNERGENFKQFLVNLEAIVDRGEHFQGMDYQDLSSFAKLEISASKRVNDAEARFYWLLSNFYFLPNSPTLMNAGRKLQQLSACYVLPIEDSVEGWMKTAMDAAIIHKTGGGTGFAASRVRPTGDSVQSTKGIASGPLSPLKIINTMTEEIKQGGQRRGANMGILYYKHPNIEDFIKLKAENPPMGDKPGELENLNVSVAIDEEFIIAVKENKEIGLVNPKDNKIVGYKNAKELFDLIIKCAWSCGDPGYVVIDRINNSTSNPTPKLGQIESTNPCGEQPLLPYEPCNLGSINLSKIVKDKSIDYALLEEVVKTSIWFLDDVIDVNNYPIPEIEEIAKGNRRIGLGVMGWAELLVKLEIPYDSKEAFETAEKIMEFINEKSLEASESLAKERGVFPNYKDCIYDPNSENFRGHKAMPRNCARTTIAPTGTIALAAGLKGSGIEPFFGICYERYQAEGVDALKKGLKPDRKYVYFEVVPEFLEYGEKCKWFGLDKETVLKKVADNGGSLKGLEAVPESIQRLFQCAPDLDYKAHINIQVAFQRYVDNAVSKTINMPNNATIDDIAAAYLYAYDMGVKGLTVYRDGSKSIQVLQSSKEKKDEKSLEGKIKDRRKRPQSLIATEKKVLTPFGDVFVSYGFDGVGLRETFVKIGKAGEDVNALSEALGRVISTGLKYNVPPEEFIEQLKGIGGSSSVGFGKDRILSIPDAIAKKMIEVLEYEGPVLIETYQKLYGEKKEIETKEKSSNGSSNDKKNMLGFDLCPSCRLTTLYRGEGCEKCYNCEYEKC